MTKEEMSAKIQNAFHSIGNEESMPKFPGIEFMTQTVKLQEIAGPDGHTPIIDWSPDSRITQLLNTGWSMGRHIVCPPFVMFIFHRVKEEKNNA